MAGELWWVAIVAAIITSIAAIITAIVWPSIQARWRKHYLEKLILSELAELRPTIEKLDGTLKSHLSKDFVHKKIIFDNPAQNPELIFCINRKLLYHTNQLWSAYERNDVNKWLTHLAILAFKIKSKKHLVFMKKTPEQEEKKSLLKNKNKEPKTDKESIKKAYFEWKEAVGKYTGQAPEPKVGLLFEIQGIEGHFKPTNSQGHP